MNEVNNSAWPMHVGIVVTSPAQLAAVYAVLAGVSTNAVAVAAPGKPAPVKQDTAPVSDTSATASPESPASDGTGLTATSDASPSDPNEVDAHGWPWSPDLHASTRGQTKDGLWRMKVGVTRPDPKPGFPIADAGSTSTASTGETASTPNEAAPAPAASVADEDDEFAAFRAASEKVDAAAASAAPPVRKWTDADLGALCNQAAVKLGDPVPIKEIIATYVPAGEVAHSRNVPDDKRAAFAAAVEAKAGIQFAG